MTEQELLMTFEGEVIRRLLSGNDTCCFTTQQYADMAEKVCEEWIGATRQSLGVPLPSLHVRRRQLEAITNCIEVQPDVWTLEGFLDSN
jgi:hypothetical protein